jgi:acetyl esterase/lipase
MSNTTPPPTLPTSILPFLANAGPSEAFYTPPQSIFPGARSYMNYPFAAPMGYRPLRLDLHVPDDRGGPLPVIVYASGGGWRIVSKNYSVWRFLLAEGYAVASVEYRVSDEAKFPAPLHDVNAAIRWVRANAEKYNLDPNRVAGWGSSAGAYLLSLAAVTNGMSEFEGNVGEHSEQPSVLACVIDHYGPSDLNAMPEDTNSVPNVIEPMGTAVSPETLLLGYLPADRPADAARASVVTYVKKDVPPFLIMHGDADTRLGIGQSKRFYDALKHAGADAEFHPLPGANHGGPPFESEDTQAKIRAFLKRTIGLGGPPR